MQRTGVEYIKETNSMIAIAFYGANLYLRNLPLLFRILMSEYEEITSVVAVLTLFIAVLMSVAENIRSVHSLMISVALLMTS